MGKIYGEIYTLWTLMKYLYYSNVFAKIGVKRAHESFLARIEKWAMIMIKNWMNNLLLA